MKNIEMPTLEELQEMAAVDIRTVDKSTLAELDDVEIHEELPQAERIADYIKQIKNPYCYKSHGIVDQLCRKMLSGRKPEQMYLHEKKNRPEKIIEKRKKKVW